jgi:hypothetical protein
MRHNVMPQDRGNEVTPSRRNNDVTAPAVSREKMPAEQKPVVVQRQKKDTEVRTAETPRTEVYGTTAERGVTVQPAVRRSNRTGTGATVDVETTPSGRVEITPRTAATTTTTTITKRTYAAPVQTEEVPAKPAKTVIVTKTTNGVPEDSDHEERHEDHGFFHRLFHHERKVAPVTTTVEESN